MSRILVTGFTGFIGRGLMAFLRQEGHDVVGLSSRDGQIDDPDIWSRIVPESFDRVSYSVKHIIDVIQATAGTHKEVMSANTVRPNGINDVVADISRAGEFLGWQPRHSFEEGIVQMIQAVSGAANE